MQDLGRIRENVGKMIDAGAPESDIDAYLREEGTDAETLRTAPLDLPAPPPSLTTGPLRRRSAPAEQPQPSPLDTGETIEGGIATTLDGVLPGSAGVFGGLRGLATGDGWTAGRSATNDLIDRFGKENPGTSMALHGAGMVGGLFLPGANLVRAAEGASAARVIGMGMLNNGITGAGYGALSGAMTADSLGDIPERMAEGGLAGGAMGAGMTPAMHVGSSYARTAINNIPGLSRSNAARAQAERLMNSMSRQAQIHGPDGLPTATPATPGNVQAEVAARQAAGVPAMPADVNPNFQRVLGASVQGAGPMSQHARTTLSSRQLGQRGRVSEHLDATMGPADNVQLRSDEIMRDANRMANPHYQEAKGIPTEMTPGLQDAMRSSFFPQILQRVVRNLTSDSRNMRDPRMMGFTVHPDGRVEANLDNLTTEGWIEIQKAAAQAAGDLRQPTAIPGVARSSVDSRGVESTARHVADELGAQNDPYNTARRTFADEAQGRDALEMGAEMPRQNGQQAEAAASRLPRDPTTGDVVPNAADMYRLGGRSGMETLVANGTKNTNIAQDIQVAVGSQDPRKIAQVRAAYGDDVVDELMRRLGYENQAWSTMHTATGGSPTQPRQAIDQAITDATRAPGSLMHMLTSGWKGAVINHLFAGGNAAGHGQFKQDVMNRIAEVWGATNPADAASGLAALVQRARSDRAFADSLNSAGLSISRLISMQLAAQDNTPRPMLDTRSEGAIAPLTYDDGTLITGELPPADETNQPQN